MRSLSTDEKALSSITSLEVRSAIRRRERSGNLTATDAATALRGLEYELARLIIHPLSDTLVQRAIVLIDKCRVKALDSLQPASALEIADSSQDPVLFLSADAFLLEAARSQRLPTWNPEDHP
jgi:predicted nucleic acid-binding protein